jgi:hypothetical protein
MPTPAPKLFQSIFTQYDGWDDNGLDILLVHDATLAQNLEPFKKEDVFVTLVINMDTAQLELWKGNESYLYDLIVSFTLQPVPVVEEEEDEDEQGWDD